nr:MAG TPA: hypothetical protein [Microviridae sp.]
MLSDANILNALVALISAIFGWIAARKTGPK